MSDARDGNRVSIRIGINSYSMPCMPKITSGLFRLKLVGGWWRGEMLGEDHPPLCKFLWTPTPPLIYIFKNNV